MSSAPRQSPFHPRPCSMSPAGQGPSCWPEAPSVRFCVCRSTVLSKLGRQGKHSNDVRGLRHPERKPKTPAVGLWLRGLERPMAVSLEGSETERVPPSQQSCRRPGSSLWLLSLRTSCPREPPVSWGFLGAQDRFQVHTGVKGPCMRPPQGTHFPYLTDGNTA